MYESFFGLREAAFSLAPDPRFLWLSETHEEGLSALYYAVVRRKGFALLTGEVGAGKTTLLRALLHRIPEATQVALITNTLGLNALDLLKLIEAEFGIWEPGLDGWEGTADHVVALRAFLHERALAGLETLLIVDEAQNLDLEALEQLRLLSNLETEQEKLVQIILTGQPELRPKLAHPQLRQLRQRIALEHHVEALGPGDVLPYLEHRIHVAGGRYDAVFEPGSEPVFFAFSRGCPRLVNLLADRALLAAFSRQLRPVPRALLEEKARAATAGLTGQPPAPQPPAPPPRVPAQPEPAPTAVPAPRPRRPRPAAAKPTAPVPDPADSRLEAQGPGSSAARRVARPWPAAAAGPDAAGPVASHALVERKAREMVATLMGRAAVEGAGDSEVVVPIRRAIRRVSVEVARTVGAMAPERPARRSPPRPQGL